MLGLSAWKTGDRDAAVRAFTQALEKDSTHVKSRLNLSRVLIEQGKAQEALPYAGGVFTRDSRSTEVSPLSGRGSPVPATARAPSQTDRKRCVYTSRHTT